jgi:NADH dehydrogenase/NADH:ubiquinone oxidoreductase subunit G
MKKNKFLLGTLELLLAFGTVLAACSKKDSGATNWKKALNEYESFVDEYVAFMKKAKANPNDPAVLEKYESIVERWEQMEDLMFDLESELEDSLSEKDFEKFSKRYAKITEKMVKPSTTNWKKALSEYESFFDEIVAFAKKYKANPNDPAVLEEYESLDERWEQMEDLMSDLESELEDSLSEKDFKKFSERYAKIQESGKAKVEKILE